MPTKSGGTAASEWGVGDPLTRAIALAAAAINAGQTLTFDVDCAGDNELTVFAAMTGGASGDLTVAVRPYRGAGNATIYPGEFVPAIRSSGPTFAAPNVSFEGTYDVSGVAKVRVDITNNNVGAQTVADASWRLS